MSALARTSLPPSARWPGTLEVLVATDFDGTLAPPGHRPDDGPCHRGRDREALRAAAAMPGVTVALVSGRDVDTLRQLSGVGPQEPIVLVGGHGAHTSLDHEDDAPCSARTTRRSCCRS